MPRSGSRSEDLEHRTHQVLVIEDNPDTALLIEHALTGPGVPVEILTFADGQAALDHLHGTGDRPPADALPSLILLDLNLPRLDGRQVLERLRADPRTEMVPVVVFTSSDEIEDRQDCYERGANSYVRKPVDFDRFSDVLGRVAGYWLGMNHLPYEPQGPPTVPQVDRGPDPLS